MHYKEESKGGQHEGKSHSGSSKGSDGSVPINYPNAMGFPHTAIAHATGHKK